MLCFTPMLAARLLTTATFTLAQRVWPIWIIMDVFARGSILTPNRRENPLMISIRPAMHGESATNAQANSAEDTESTETECVKTTLVAADARPASVTWPCSVLSRSWLSTPKCTTPNVTFPMSPGPETGMENVARKMT